MMDTALFPCGSIDDQIADWQAILAQVPCEYLSLIWHYTRKHPSNR